MDEETEGGKRVRQRERERERERVMEREAFKSFPLLDMPLRQKGRIPEQCSQHMKGGREGGGKKKTRGRKKKEKMK